MNETAKPEDNFMDQPEMDAEAAGPEPGDTIETDGVEDRFRRLEEETGELKNQLLRALAETENIRKRSERQIADERVYAIERFARDVLSVSDNLARALEALPDEDRAALTERGQNLLSGVEMTQKELHAVMARHGVVAVDATPGTAFDPNAHQAVSQIPSDEPQGSVAQTFQTGWKIGDRVLRAAMVAVSAGPAN